MCYKEFKIKMDPNHRRNTEENIFRQSGKAESFEVVLGLFENKLTKYDIVRAEATYMVTKIARKARRFDPELENFYVSGIMSLNMPAVIYACAVLHNSFDNRITFQDFKNFLYSIFDLNDSKLSNAYRNTTDLNHICNARNNPKGSQNNPR